MELGEWNMNDSHPICCNRNKNMLIKNIVLPHLKRHRTSLLYIYTQHRDHYVIQLSSPSNSGQIFLQQVMPPWLVYCPRAVSRMNRGMPQVTRYRIYGMKKAPAEQAGFTKSRPLFTLTIC